MEKVLVGILAGIGFIALVVLLLGWPLMLLWNWLMPTIFGLPIITFWQAVGLNLLSTVLFNQSTIKKKVSNYEIKKFISANLYQR